MPDHFSVTVPGGCGRIREPRTGGEIGNLVDVDDVGDAVLVADVGTAKVAHAKRPIGPHGCFGHALDVFRVQLGGTAGQDIIVEIRLRDPLALVGEQVLEGVFDQRVILLRDGQRFHYLVSPHRNGQLPPVDELFHQGGLIVMLRDIGNALEHFRLRVHHRFQVDAQAGIVGERLDDGGEGKAENACGLIEHLVTRRGHPGGIQAALGATLVDAGRATLAVEPVCLKPSVSIRRVTLVAAIFTPSNPSQLLNIKAVSGENGCRAFFNSLSELRTGIR